MNFKQIVKNYSGFVSYHPYLMVLLVISISVFAVFEAKNIQMKSMDYKDMLPDDIEVMKTLEIIGDEFGGTDSAMIAIEVVPNHKGSDETRDVRDPDIIKYLQLLTQTVLHVDYVISATSPASILKSKNNNTLPKTRHDINPIVKESSALSSYLSSDYKIALIKISLADGFDEDEMLVDLNKVLNEVPKPSGVNVAVAGQDLAMSIVKQSIGSDMQKTTRVSLIGILIVLFLLFRSIRFGLTPLATIGVGILWAFGFIGLIGMGMSSATSGVISMIMGIGIDFGIQTVTRFRQELKKMKAEQAMEITLNAVFMPMATTTMAALIGFKAMSFGELTMMAEMGTMMSYGIAACFLAAITIVPALLVIGERLTNKKQRQEDTKIFNRLFLSRINHGKGG
ncbi:MAG: efflux RND transporter permease subunit [Nanoarchaeota archaeon]